MALCQRPRSQMVKLFFWPLPIFDKKILQKSGAQRNVKPASGVAKDSGIRGGISWWHPFYV